jgi:hypothetical protein
LARTTNTATDARYYLYDGAVGEVDVNGVVQAAKKYDVYGAAAMTI